MGDVYYQLDSLENAANCYKKSLAIFERKGRKNNEATTLYSLGRLQVKAKRYSEAIPLLQRCEKIAEENHYFLVQRDSLQLLAENADKLDANTVSAYYRQLLKSADGLVDLLKNLLNWAQIQTGRNIYRPSSFDLVSALQSDIGVTKSMAARKGEKGTGLGLIVCKEFLEKHGSTLHVESEAGKGSRFWFELSESSII